MFPATALLALGMGGAPAVYAQEAALPAGQTPDGQITAGAIQVNTETARITPRTELPPENSVQIERKEITAYQEAKPDRLVDFEADMVEYDSVQDRIVASGAVILKSGDRTIHADKVIWERKTGQVFGRGNVLIKEKNRSVRADDVIWNSNTDELAGTGNIRMLDENGNQLFTSGIELTGEFEAGAMEDLLLALREGGRLAAKRGQRSENGTVELETAAYSACAVTDDNGCAKNPSWRITADRVTYTPSDKKVHFKGAYLEIFGQRLLPMPGLSVRTDGQAVSGFLIPGFRISESNGVEVTGSYYTRIDANRDLAVNTHLFTKAPPLVSAQWRHLMKRGAYQLTAYGTHSSRISNAANAPEPESDWRGYIFANGRFQLDPNWSVTGSVRLASDRTFLRRYDISRDDRLRSTVNLERIDKNSYLSIAGWATQTLRLNQDQGQVPFAFPVMDYRQRVANPAGINGSTLEFQANTLGITRKDGQDTQRAFAGARWDLRRITPWGQLVSLTGLVRGDVYHSDENDLTQTAIYRGNPGWETRGIALAALDVKWPFVGEAFGGTQVFTPRVQLVATPQLKNLAVPNEDSRAIDLEDSNVFSLNRFPGYDRFEDGVRLTYGLNWELQRPNWLIRTRIAQSYRIDKDPEILLDGTGLSERFSDIVGRTELQYRDFVKFAHRYRVDKDSFKIRHNEVDATIGSQNTYTEIGYLRLNRDITAGIEDLQDREELRLATRIAFAKYWSVFGSGIFNLTNDDEDPILSSDGFEPIRTRLGIAYQDDCLEMGLTWRRDYVTSGDAQRGNTFQLYFALRNFGVR